MNKQEAIETLKELNENYFSDEFDEANEALVEGISALKKQIPKKPDFEGDGYADGCLVYDTWICPCCGKHYEVDYDDYKHCPSCGQAIDWSGEDE